MKNIIVKGAREHNLNDIDLILPRNKFIVVTGVSGSGKSSLAFDTIYAEGQRRYVESLSSYARQFLGRIEKPDIDYIDGLSPAISIEQKGIGHNPRSTVGTITEIYDYYRLLYSRIGIPHDPKSGKPIKRQTIDEIIEIIFSLPLDSYITIAAPIVYKRKGTHKKILDDARNIGYVRANINGEIRLLNDSIQLKKNTKHNIEIIIDRLKLSPNQRKRIAEAVEASVNMADGLVNLYIENNAERKKLSFSQQYAYTDSNCVFPKLEPRLFSFNSPIGACSNCSGLGHTLEFDKELLIPHSKLSFNQGAILTYNPNSTWTAARFNALAEALKFDLNKPINKLSPKIIDALFYGSDRVLKVKYKKKDGTGIYHYQTKFPGIFADLKRRYVDTNSDGIKAWLEKFMSTKICNYCFGKRLSPEALSVQINGVGIADLASMSIEDELLFFNELKLNKTDQKIADDILKEIILRLSFLENVGLEYLSLDRAATTLSGGEAQRIRLATQIGSSLVGVLYILDEPTIGLHQRDNAKLLKTLMNLRDMGNTLIVVEHDEQTVRNADHVIELGPGAGIYGGNVVFQGSVKGLLNHSQSLTGQYLNRNLSLSFPKMRRVGNNKIIRLTGVEEHNLKNIDVSFPLGMLILITGVSGSGKSTLLSDVLYPLIQRALKKSGKIPGKYKSITGLEYIDNVINISQVPIGRTPRSNPATYVGLFGLIRELFSNLPASRANGYKPGRFSFNLPGGRCDNCQGAGTIKIEMHFMPDVYVLCDVCKGKRFNHETLQICYRGKNIHDVLDMSVDEARKFFSSTHKICRYLNALTDVGLNYIKLGQSALTLSGGEAQRIKLALELSKRDTGSTIYIMDEPTTGLHMADVNKLLEAINLLVDRGNTVIIIEHSMDVILQADYIIDLGPDGGNKGGNVIASGAPEKIMKCKGSYTGRFLRSHCNDRIKNTE